MTSNGVSYHVLVAEGATFRLYHVNGALEIVLAEVNEDGQPASKIAGAEAVELRNWLNRVLPRQESVETQPAASKPLTRQVEEGMRLRHAFVEEAGDKLSAARHMAYLSHLDRGELLAEVERLRDDYKALSENCIRIQDRAINKANECEARMFQSWKALRQQHKGMNRMARKIARLRPMAESWESQEAAQDRKGSAVETTEDEDPCVSHVAMKGYEHVLGEIRDHSTDKWAAGLAREAIGPAVEPAEEHPAARAANVLVDEIVKCYTDPTPENGSDER